MVIFSNGQSQMTFWNVQVDLFIISQAIVNSSLDIVGKISMSRWTLNYLEEGYRSLTKQVILATILEMMENLHQKLALQINFLWQEAGLVQVATKINSKILKTTNIQVKNKIS